MKFSRDAADRCAQKFAFQADKDKHPKTLGQWETLNRSIYTGKSPKDQPIESCIDCLEESKQELLLMPKSCFKCVNDSLNEVESPSDTFKQYIAPIYLQCYETGDFDTAAYTANFSSTRDAISCFNYECYATQDLSDLKLATDLDTYKQCKD